MKRRRFHTFIGSAPWMAPFELSFSFGVDADGHLSFSLSLNVIYFLYTELRCDALSGLVRGCAYWCLPSPGHPCINTCRGPSPTRANTSTPPLNSRFQVCLANYIDISSAIFLVRFTVDSTCACVGVLKHLRPMRLIHHAQRVVIPYAISHPYNIAQSGCHSRYWFGCVPVANVTPR